MIWEFIHNAVAHPLLAFSFNARWAVRFHDWTSKKAWPTPESPVRDNYEWSRENPPEPDELRPAREREMER